MLLSSNLRPLGTTVMIGESALGHSGSGKGGIETFRFGLNAAGSHVEGKTMNTNFNPSE
jgi:hypothetical protein